MIWLFFSLVFIFLAVMYIFVPNFRQTLNAYIEGAAFWLATTIHLPTWIVTATGWLWGKFKGFMLGVIWLGVGFTLLYAYAYTHSDQQTLLYVLAGSAIVLYLLLVATRWIDGLRQWLFNDTDAGAMIKSFCTAFLWIAVQLALLSVPNGWYFNHLIVVGFLFLALIVFTVKGWYYGEPPKHAGWILSIIFIGALVFSVYKNWEIGQFTLPRPIESRLQQAITNSDRESIVRETDAGITLAVFQKLSVGYVKAGDDFMPDSVARFVDGDTVSVDDHKKSPVHYKGEMMYEVVQANDYGDYMGTNVWVPARKLRYISPVVRHSAAKAKADSLAQFQNEFFLDVVTKDGDKIIFKNPNRKWLNVARLWANDNKVVTADRDEVLFLATGNAQMLHFKSFDGRGIKVTEDKKNVFLIE